jgi:hypothetical protein
VTRKSFYGIAIALQLCTFVPKVLALDGAVPAISGNTSRNLLGDGTGVIVGIVDSGIDDLHPTLAGLDSLGNPRMVAKANFVTGEPGNTGDDVYGHGTWVASAALGSDATYTGLATDARFVNARVLNSNNGFPNDTPVRNGVGYAIDQGADILNLSLNFFAANSGGNSQLDLMIDWAAYARGICSAVSVGNIASGNGTQSVRGPGSAFNGITVGRTTADFSRVHFDSGVAYTQDGRMKPDMVAPGSGLILANDDWEGSAGDWDVNLNGSSFATPLVAGMMAQQLEAGSLHGLSTNPLVVKATMMNAASKVPDKNNLPWEPGSAVENSGVISAVRPLDTDSGAGQIDGLRLSQQYLAGEMSPGLVDPIGWDMNSLSTASFVDYSIDLRLMEGSKLTATLAWNRHVGRNDDGNGIVDANDFFYSLENLSNLDLQLFADGLLVAESVSTLDNVEHLYLPVERHAQYTLRVLGTNVTSSSEEFALAWFGTAVPEPTGLTVTLLAVVGIVARRFYQTGRHRFG